MNTYLSLVSEETPSQHAAAVDPIARGDESAGVPQDIRKKLESRQPVQLLPTPTPGAWTKCVLIIDRIGSLVSVAGQPALVMRGVGWNGDASPIRLLPCRSLEHAERIQSQSADYAFFRVVGLQTRYQGQPYVLLQQTIRVYGHGNFT